MKCIRHFSFLLVVLSFTFGTQAIGQFGIPDVPKSDSKTIDEIKKEQDHLVQSYMAYALEMTEAQMYMAEAFGLADEAGKLKSLKEKLKKNSNLDKGEIEKQRALNKEVQGKIDEKIAADTVPSEEGKKLFAMSLPPYINSAKKAKKTSEQAEKSLKKAKKALESASALDKAKITESSDLITFLAPKIPGDAAVMATTGSKYISFAQKHGIEVPDNAMDAFK